MKIRKLIEYLLLQCLIMVFSFQKIGDFGLATKLSRPDETHQTMCGTPNYISPEVSALHFCIISYYFLYVVLSVLGVKPAQLNYFTGCVLQIHRLLVIINISFTRLTVFITQTTVIWARVVMTRPLGPILVRLSRDKFSFN